MSDLDLARLLDELAKKHSVPGAAVGVLRDGERTFACHGVADTRSGRPVTAATRFGLGSLTKSMVATAIARLAEAGTLALDDPVARHVPELRGATWAERDTLRDLLANRSGVPLRDDFEFDFLGWDQEDDVLSRFAARIASGAGRADFWSYSNVGWCVLGRALATVTGRSWEDAMQEFLLKPAGMDQTTFWPRRASDQWATGHEVADGCATPVERWAARAYGPAGVSGVSTVTDLLEFAAVHLEDPSLAFLRVTQAEIRITGWFDAWCLGWARFDWEGGPVWGWDGLLNGERAILRLVPEQHGAAVLLTNSSTGRALYRELFTHVMHEAFGITVPTRELERSPRAAEDLSRFAGVYAWPDRRVEVSATETRLVIEGRNGAKEAHPLDDRTFLVDAADPDTPTVTFDGFGADGRPNVLYQMVWGLPRSEA